jgi:amino acid transporter
MNPRRQGGLGTFLGVFTPTILTILGVIMYLRFGWVLGQAGLAGTLTIVALANATTLITTLSFSAIATNSRVGVGGAYYIISRSLGLEMGGAIGLPLFLSQSFSVTLYAFGLAESIRIVWPEVPVQPAAFVIVLAVGLLTLRGAGLALKIQVPLMVLIGLSLVALVAGSTIGPRVTVDPQPIEAPGFWTVFAVFFPAVTGVMAGLGLSGDLRDPIRSIPRGAIAATLVGFAVYLGIPFVLLHGASSAALIQDPLIWTRIAVLGPLLVLPGLWGAVFSSAVGSMLGAPRTLQAMAMDGLAPRFLAPQGADSGGVTAGLVVSLAISLGAVLLGDLNAVAPVVTMFFLTVYGMVNLVAALESLSGDPSWRPRLNVPWPLALAGGLGCFAVMILIHPLAAIAAIAIEILLWVGLTRREQRAGWGDVRRGVYESLIRWSLIRLSQRSMTARNWRPHVIVFADDVARRLDLVRFATWFSQERGVVTVCQLVVGDLLTSELDVDADRRRIQTLLDREGLTAFGEVDIVPDVIEGMTDVAQANGIAGLTSNTILLGLPREGERLAEFLQVVTRLERLHKSVVIGRVEPELKPRTGQDREIHVWWGGLRQNGDLMLLLAHLLTRNPGWRRAKIRLLSLASTPLMKERTEAYLAKFLPEIRMSAEADVMLLPEDRTVREIIHEKSARADVVFLGLRVPDSKEQQADHAQRLLEMASALRTVFFVKNSSLFVGKLVQTTDELAEAPAPPVESTSTAPAGAERGTR